MTTKVIWKFPLVGRGWVPVTVGAPSKVVLTAIDPASEIPCVWIEHPGDAGAMETREFGVFPTGGTIAADSEHVGSMLNGPFVWHVYERRS